MRRAYKVSRGSRGTTRVAGPGLDAEFTGFHVVPNWVLLLLQEVFVHFRRRIFLFCSAAFALGVLVGRLLA